MQYIPIPQNTAANMSEVYNLALRNEKINNTRHKLFFMLFYVFSILIAIFIIWNYGKIDWTINMRMPIENQNFNLIMSFELVNKSLQNAVQNFNQHVPQNRFIPSKMVLLPLTQGCTYYSQCIFG